ncbi:MAG: hypothetical protein JNK10_05265 [Cyclobacteriaceae bacterium]|nr:hypothetical protein [Cyclobacteriaceae bacterium]
MMIRSLIVVFFLLVGISLTSRAQSQDITGGLDLSFGRGATLFGVSGRFEKPIENRFSWMATAGLQFGSGVTLFTLQGGAKYTLEENVYLGAEIGPLFASGGGASDTAFGFTPTIGYKWDKFDLSSRFFLGGGGSLFNIRFAYVFTSR